VKLLPVERISATSAVEQVREDDGDETRAAQGEYLAALVVATQMVQ
jgi:hypothetical protein